MYSLGNDGEAMKYFMKELELSQQSQVFVTSEVAESIAEIACKNSSLSIECTPITKHPLCSFKNNLFPKKIKTKSETMENRSEH